MKEFWDKLTATQKYYVAGGAAFVLVVLMLQLAVIPLWDAKQKLNRSIAVNEKALKDMIALGGEYAVLKQRAEDIQRAQARRPQDFTLFSYLEKKAGETQLKPHIKYMNASKAVAAGAFEESIVEMRLDALTLRQLTDFLHTVESPQDLVRIKKITVAKMKESPEYLTMTMQASTYLPAKPGSR
jgi:general secretion pathway protein M